MQKLKKFAALLLTVLMITSTVSAGVSVVSADESHTSEIMTDVPETTDTTETTADVTEESSEQETQETQEVTEPTEETTEPTEATEEPTGETTEETEETLEPTEETQEPTEELPEEIPEMPKGPESGDRIVGDFNGDGTINIVDVTDVQKYIAGLLDKEDLVWGDLSGDKYLSIEDATLIQSLLAFGNSLNIVEEKDGVYDPEFGKVMNLDGKNYTEDQITLTWDAVDGAAGYEIFAYLYNGNKYVKIGDSSENSFTIASSPASGYNVSVRAWYQDEDKVYIGNYSDSVNVLTAPKAGVFKEVLRNGDGSFAVIAEAQNFGSIVSKDGQVIGTITDGKANVSEDYEGLEAAVENKFIYGNKTSASCSEYFVLEGDMPLFNASIAAVQGNTVTINWDKIEGAHGYEVFKMDENGEYVSIADTTKLSFDDIAEYGTRNCYSVKYYVVKDGEKVYYSENLLEAVVAPKAEESITLWSGDTVIPMVDSMLDYSLESTNTDVVTVDGKRITAVNSGTAQVKVLGDWSEEITIDIIVKKAPTELTLSTYNMIILETEGLTINAYLDEGAESKITFTSSDPSKASVDEKGFVIAYKAGNVTITVETENGLKAECNVEIYPVDSRTFKVEGVVMNGPSWDSGVITKLSKGTGAFVLETKGTWNRIRYGGDVGWVYNRSFDTSIKNYSSISVGTLETVVDDEIFNLGGPDLQKIFLFVRNMPYRSAINFGTDEANCVYALQYRSGVCWHHSALFNYMADRIGYEVMYIEGTHYSAHRWTLIHHENGWYHYDATPLYHGAEFVEIYHATDAVTAKWMTWDRSKYPATPKE